MKNNFKIIVRIGGWLLISICLSACDSNHAEPQSTVPSIVMAQPGARGYAVGSLNGVKVRIPAEYQFFGVQYEGENAFDKTTWRKMPATMDTPITEFSILLRASNFEPRRNPQDHKDWVAEGSNFENKTDWLNIGVQHHSAANITPRTFVDKWHSSTVEQLHTRGAGGLIYDLKTQPDSLYGLQVNIPIERPNQPQPKFKWHEDHLYLTPKESKEQAVVSCTPPEEHHPKKIWFCEQRFLLARIASTVTVRYRIDQLPRWQEIQTKVSVIVNSFVVQEKNADTTKQVPAAVSSPVIH